MLHDGGTQMMRFGRRFFWISTVLLLVQVNCHPVGPGSERWVYRLMGSGYSGAQAAVVACGSDGMVYAAGQSGYFPSDTIFVVALDATGKASWTYTRLGNADAITLGADGNIYVAGSANVPGSYTQSFLVFSLTPAGVERWAFQSAADSSGGTYSDYASAVACGADGNVYAAGAVLGRFAVTSLTAGGQERWTSLKGPAGDYTSYAQSLLWGSDGNVYAAGTLADTALRGSARYASVVGFTPAGVERWTYSRRTTDTSASEGSSLVQGMDGNLYFMSSLATRNVYFTSLAEVVSLTLDGAERWIHDYVAYGGTYAMGGASALARRADQGVFLGMYESVDTVSPYSRFAAASLDASGQETWSYRHSAKVTAPNALTLTTGADGNLYCCGNFDASDEFSIASLTSSGSLRWVYGYATGLFGGAGAAQSITTGGGDVFAGGFANGYNVGQYFLVVSLSAGGGAN
jgi:hypothetical protein